MDIIEILLPLALFAIGCFAIMYCAIAFNYYVNVEIERVIYNDQRR